jgi:hypothetical protein
MPRTINNPPSSVPPLTATAGQLIRYATTLGPRCVRDNLQSHYSLAQPSGGLCTPIEGLPGADTRSFVLRTHPLDDTVTYTWNIQIVYYADGSTAIGAEVDIDSTNGIAAPGDTHTLLADTGGDWAIYTGTFDMVPNAGYDIITVVAPVVAGAAPTRVYAVFVWLEPPASMGVGLDSWGVPSVDTLDVAPGSPVTPRVYSELVGMAREAYEQSGWEQLFSGDKGCVVPPRTGEEWTYVYYAVPVTFDGLPLEITVLGNTTTPTAIEVVTNQGSFVFPPDATGALSGTHSIGTFKTVGGIDSLRIRMLSQGVIDWLQIRLTGAMIMPSAVAPGPTALVDEDADDLLDESGNRLTTGA